jgi:hypothetical protein
VDRAGWTAGGGVEYSILGPWSAKLEYLYADLGDATCGAATCGTPTTVSFTENIVRVGVNYRFWQPARARIKREKEGPATRSHVCGPAAFQSHLPRALRLLR